MQSLRYSLLAVLMIACGSDGGTGDGGVDASSKDATAADAKADNATADVSIADVVDAQTDDVDTTDAGDTQDATTDDADAGPMPCPCAYPWLCCGNVCVYPLTDPNNCGMCGIKCQHACVNRVCN
jgi:hypothetical protein